MGYIIPIVKKQIKKTKRGSGGHGSYYGPCLIRRFVNHLFTSTLICRSSLNPNGLMFCLLNRVFLTFLERLNVRVFSLLFDTFIYNSEGLLLILKPSPT